MKDTLLDFEDRWARDNEREPDYGTRPRRKLNPHGTVRSLTAEATCLGTDHMPHFDSLRLDGYMEGAEEGTALECRTCVTCRGSWSRVTRDPLAILRAAGAL